MGGISIDLGVEKIQVFPQLCSFISSVIQGKSLYLSGSQFPYKQNTIATRLLLQFSMVIDLKGSVVLLVVNNLAASAGYIGDTILIPGLGRSPGGGHATHSSILAWRIPWTKEPSGLQPIELQRVGHD